MNRLLIVANDNTASLRIGMELEQGGLFHATMSSSVAEAAARGTNGAGQYDAVLIVTSAASTGLAGICGRVRQFWSHCPIIVLTPDADEATIVNTLDAGASDVIQSPHRVGELRARVQAHIRAHANSTGVSFQIGPYLFHPATRILQHVTTGAGLRLTHKETEVLKYLNRSNGQAIGRQTLLRDVWGYKKGADSYTVESHIYRLRRKIEADPARPRFLVNADGGYALVAVPPRPWPQTRAQSGLQLAG
jgi:DNA-binding response OmpR family regulator